MLNATYIKFIEELLVKTKVGELEWNYLDHNNRLCIRMGWTDVLHSPEFDVEDSYYAELDNYFVVLYTPIGEPIRLYVIPSTFRKIVGLDASDYGEYITRLLNEVRRTFPDANNFIESIVNQADAGRHDRHKLI